MKTYLVNEMFYSLQGEGARAGTANVFIRFSGCNLRCSLEPGPRSPGGFDCDTEFMGGRRMTGEEILKEAEQLLPTPRLEDRAVIFTGGEPMLQLDEDLAKAFEEHGFFKAVETNGTIAAPWGVYKRLNWIVVSPKTAEHTLRIERADELRYVRDCGQALPRPKLESQCKYISPAFTGMEVDPKTLAWCIGLVKFNPGWRLSVQQHKLWRVR